jgi:ABC-type Fe3+ transport system substrate-binding protein
MSMDRDGGEWVMMLWAAWGKEKSINYLQKLAKNGLAFSTGATARTEMLAAGAHKIDLRLNLNRILDYQEKGAPLDWVRTDPIPLKGTPMFIAERAPHPNAAILFADWFTSLERAAGLLRRLRKTAPGSTNQKPNERSLEGAEGNTFSSGDGGARPRGRSNLPRYFS